MKGRVDSTKIWGEPSAINGPASQDMPGSGPKMDAEVKAEVKDEDGRKSTDSRPPSRKLNNGDSDITLSMQAEDNNNKRVKLEKKADRRRRKSFFTGDKSENGKPGSVGSESQKASPVSTPQLPVSGINTPVSVMCPTQGVIVTSSEPPFMQQQSEIFVFSTNLANQAAESVRMGHCKTIIQFHMDHPNTKAFLQKHPLKPNNFRHGIPQGQAGPGIKMENPPTSGMMRMHGPPTSSWGPSGPMEDPAMMGPGGMMPNHPYPPTSAGPRMMGGWGPCGGPHPHPMGPGNYPPGPMMDMENEYMMANAGGIMNISSSQVPDENLTSEQRQHRSKGLAQLTKIHQMLMGSNGSQDGRHPPLSGPDGRPGGPASMYPGGPPGSMMTSQQQAMMSQQQAMMSQGGMMPPHGMMSPQQQHHHNMMVQQGMPPYGPRGPGPGMPGMNGKDQFHAQREWFHIQQEHYMEKQQRMQHMRGPQMEPGPPPSYYSSISQKHGNMSRPTSPSMNGMRMPMPPHGPPMGPGMDPEGMAMYGAPHDMCRPPHMGMDPMAPGMHGYPMHHGMPPQGPMDPGFDPTMAGAMPPGMSPGGPRHPGPMPPQGHPHMMGPNGMMGPGHAKTPSQVTLHRAGNPEQFNPETMGGVIPPVMPSNSNTNSGSNSKPPPSYAQAQKRKRDDLDDYSKGNLQQTPSPTKIQYHLNQFEGQELTITKQLNAAYVAGNGGEDSMCPAGVGGSHFNSHSSSPLHGPGSNKGPLSNSSQTSAHLSSPPVASTAGPSPMTVPPPQSTSSASSGANMRLSHFDPPPMSNGPSNVQHPPNSKGSSSSLSNITSASLANLAKGVENLSNQMQQNMMQGGPFHSIQVQGQMSAGGGPVNANTGNTVPSSIANSGSNSTTSVSVANSTTTTDVTSSSAPLASPATAVPSSNSSSSTPSVNNTYIATNMSISQVNVPNHPGMNSYVNMQMQSMNSETNLPPGGGPGMNPAMMGPRGPITSHQMSQSQAMMGPMGGNPGMHPSQGPLPSSGPMMTPSGAMPPHGPNPSMPPTPPVSKGSQFTSPPHSHPQMSGSHPPPSGVTSPQFPPSSTNSSVQIQQKGHNTIQYLPANPPASSQAPTGKPQPRPDIDYSGMPRFPSPHPVMDSKNQAPSTLQYFPNSSPTGPRPPMSNSLSATIGPEFANQATIAMHHSAAMRSPSLPDMPGAAAPGQPPSMGPMDPHGHPANSMSGPSPMMVGGPDPMMGMGPGGVPMRPGHSPGVMRSMPPVMGSGSLECVSPIPGMGGYMNNGPSIEQAQAQAQAHAAMMMQGNTHMTGSSPHGPSMAPGAPSGGPSPHMAPHTPMSMHGPTMPGSSPHSMPIPGQSPHVPPMSSVSSPHGTTMPPGPSPHGPPMAPGPSPHGPMPPVASPHGHMGGMSPHSSMPGAMPPHGPMGPMHGQSMPPGSMPRHPGMGVMRMPGPGMGGMPPGNPGQYGNMQYPQYQHEFYHPQSRGPRQMVPGMMSGPPGQPYGMMPNMPGPS